jgi:hypothetical protein
MSQRTSCLLMTQPMLPEGDWKKPNALACAAAESAIASAAASVIAVFMPVTLRPCAARVMLRTLQA